MLPKEFLEEQRSYFESKLADQQKEFEAKFAKEQKQIHTAFGREQSVDQVVSQPASRKYSSHYGSDGDEITFCVGNESLSKSRSRGLALPSRTSR